MKFIDLFAGIGGFRFGMESAGHECVAFCEIDKFARASYKAIHNTEGEIELHDITQVTDDEIRAIGHVDAILFDFRAKLSALLEIEEDSKILEELSSLKSQDSHLYSNLSIYSLKTSRDSLTTTKEIPLRSSSQRWMNSGMMWNGKCLTAKISEYHKTGNVCSLSDILEENVDEKFFLSEEKMRNLVLKGRRFKTDGEPMFTLTGQDRHGIVVGNTIKKYGVLQPNFNQSGVVYETDGISPTIRTMQGGGLEPKIRVREATKQGYAEASVGDSVNLAHPNSKTRRGRVGKQIANTLLTGESQGVVEPSFRIRKLTPRECWRLQGFPDWAFDKAQEVNSNSQLYKQAGNSVTVNVIKEIARCL